MGGFNIVEFPTCVRMLIKILFHTKYYYDENEKVISGSK